MTSIDWTADAGTFSRTKSVELKLRNPTTGVYTPDCKVIVNPRALNNVPCQVTNTPDPEQVYKVSATLTLADVLNMYAEDRVGLPPIAPNGVRQLGDVLDYVVGTGFVVSSYWNESTLSFLFAGRLMDTSRVLPLELPLIFKNGVGCIVERCQAINETYSGHVGDLDLIAGLPTPILTNQVGIAPGTNNGTQTTPTDGITRFVGPPTSITWDEELEATLCFKYANGLLSVTLKGTYRMVRVKEQRYLQRTGATYTGANRSWDVVEAWNYWGVPGVVFNGAGGVEVGINTLSVDSGEDTGGKPRVTFEYVWRATVPTIWKTAGAPLALPVYSKNISRTAYWLNTGGPSNTVEPFQPLTDLSASGSGSYAIGNVPTPINTLHSLA